MISCVLTNITPDDFKYFFSIKIAHFYEKKKIMFPLFCSLFIKKMLVLLNSVKPLFVCCAVEMSLA